MTTTDLAFTFLGAAVDLFLGRALPVYGGLGGAISRGTDAFGAFFGRVYVAIEAFLIWLAGGWRRAGWPR